MKKVTSLVSLVALFAAFSLTAYAAFDDVTDTHSSYDAINYVQTEGIVQGYDDGTYKPEAPINRAEFTKIIIESHYDNATIEDCDIANILDFSDTVTDVWYSKYICVAKVNNVVEGYDDGTFKPAEKINFAEAAKIIVETFGYQTQAPNPDVWYENYVRVLDELNTTPDSIATLDKFITRGEMAEMIYRLKNDITDKPSTIFIEETTTPEPTEPVTIGLNEIGDCAKVQTVDFVVDEEHLVQYGSFSWTGQIVSSIENDMTFVRFAVQNAGDAAFDYYKDLALARENQSVNRYENDTLYFALGTLEENTLFSFAEVSAETEAYIIANLDSETESAFDFAIAFIEGGGGGLEGATYACSINN